MKHHLITTLSLLVASAGIATAQETNIEPETLTVEPRISDGGHVYVMDMGINGPSAIFVLNADDLSMEGNIGAGTFANMHMAADKSTLYTVSAYMRRYTYGEVEAVIHEWDPHTLTAKNEYLTNPKAAQTLSQRGVLNPSADGKYMVVQNATPATSVSIVDRADGSELAEVPTPGCWTAYPTLDGMGFTTLCGDGRVVKYSYAADGTISEPARSEQLFDSDENPLFADAHRIGDQLVYATYGGSLYLIDDTGEVPVLARSIDFGADGWGPSGYNLMSYHAPSNTLFVMMHEGQAEGTHKTPAQEIWAVNLESGTVTGRSPANNETSIAVSGSDDPVLFGIDYLGNVRRYDVSMGDSVDLTVGATLEGLAFFATNLTTDF